MQWMDWLDKHPGAATGLPTILLVIVTAWLGVMTWLNARRTKKLAQQSAAAFKLQILVTILQGEHPVLEAAGVPRKWSALWRTKADEVRALLEAAFPAQWQEIAKNLRDAVDTIQQEAETEGDPHPT